MLEFMDTQNRVMTSLNDIDCIGAYGFITNDKKNLRINQVFTNIDDNYVAIKSANKNDKLKDALHLFVPNYEPGRFNLTHAKKVLNWFNEIKEKIEEFVEEGEKQMKADKKAELAESNAK